MKTLKSVDWEARGVKRIYWEIIAVPYGKTLEEFIIEKEAEGFEVVAETKDVMDRQAIFMEMDAIVFDRDIKPLREAEKEKLKNG